MQASTGPAVGSPVRERLWPSPGIWVIAILLGLAFGLIPAPVSAVAAYATAVVGVVVLITLLTVTTPVVEVDAESFRAGRARIGREFVSVAEPLDAAAMRSERGRQLDARAFLCIRGWLPAGVKVTLSDPADPTPYWLVSSRHPDRLARALRPE